MSQDQPQTQEVDAEAGLMSSQATDLIEEYGVRVTFGGVGLLLVVGLIVYFSGKSQERSEAAWSRFARAEDAGAFATIADEFPDQAVGVWARLAEGQEYLQAASRLQTTNRKAANAELKKAKEAFDALNRMKNIPPEAKVRAELCNAWVLEASCDGDTEKAISAYEGFLKNNPDSLYKEYIRQRIEVLKSDDAKAFYAWFDKQNPDPEDRPTPRDGFPGTMPPGHPEMPVTLPRIPDELFPSDWNELKVDDLPGLDPAPGDKEGGIEPATKGTETNEGTEKPGENSPTGSETKPATKPTSDANENKADDASGTTPKDSSKSN